jgi:hypothetical protein
MPELNSQEGLKFVLLFVFSPLSLGTSFITEYAASTDGLVCQIYREYFFSAKFLVF